jgi:hypothetical protein
MINITEIHRKCHCIINDSLQVVHPLRLFRGGPKQAVSYIQEGGREQSYVNSTSVSTEKWRPYQLTSFKHASQYSEQTTSDQNVVCDCAGIFRLLDSSVRLQHVENNQLPIHPLPRVQSGVGFDGSSRLRVVICASRHLLLHEQKLPEGIRVCFQVFFAESTDVTNRNEQHDG